MKGFIQVLMTMTLIAQSFGIKAQSNSILGSEIEWRGLANDTYEIQIIVYCKDSYVPAWNLPVISGDSCSTTYIISPDNI